MSIPYIADVARLHLGKGDILVLHNDEIEISKEEAEDIRQQVRQLTGKPNLPIVVLGRDWSLSVVEDSVH